MPLARVECRAPTQGLEGLDSDWLQTSTEVGSFIHIIGFEYELCSTFLRGVSTNLIFIEGLILQTTKVVDHRMETSDLQNSFPFVPNCVYLGH